MRKIIYLGMFGLMLFSLCSCNDWLKEDAPGSTKLKDFFTDGQTAIQVVTGSYVPLMWEYSSHDTYCLEWFIGDVASDDALKGGQNLTDMSMAYDIENFKTVASNTLVRGYYRAQFIGISRCNLALSTIPTIAPDEYMDASTKARLIAELKYLRAYYYFRLVRVFGGVPKIDFVVESSSQWKQPRATAEEIFAFVLQDLEQAQADLWNKDEYPPTDMGHATRGAALAMLMKVNLYIGDYEKARTWGDEFLRTQAGKYSLCPNYFDNFTLAGENGPESVFEIQYIADSQSDYGGDAGGFGATRGTFTTIMTRPRSSLIVGAGNAGWGFCKPTQDLYDEYETADPRRDFTIINPTDAQIEKPMEEIYLGCRYVSRKYLMEDADGTFPKLDHATRGPLNRKEIRYSDVLLMYAEACIESNKELDKAKSAINEVRGRVGLGSVEATRVALRHERRVELGMEGHRWFDLCRWGVVGETMMAYKQKYSSGLHNEGTEMANFIKDKHELFPIPAEEVRLGGLTQNNGY